MRLFFTVNSKIQSNLDIICALEIDIQIKSLLYPENRMALGLNTKRKGLLRLAGMIRRDEVSFSFLTKTD